MAKEMRNGKELERRYPGQRKALRNMGMKRPEEGVYCFPIVKDRVVAVPAGWIRLAKPRLPRWGEQDGGDSLAMVSQR